MPSKFGKANYECSVQQHLIDLFVFKNTIGTAIVEREIGEAILINIMMEG